MPTWKYVLAFNGRKQMVVSNCLIRTYTSIIISRSSTWKHINKTIQASHADSTQLHTPNRNDNNVNMDIAKHSQWIHIIID